MRHLVNLISNLIPLWELDFLSQATTFNVGNFRVKKNLFVK